MEHEVLLSKLIPPIPSAYYLRRVHLIKQLKKMSLCKLTILHSGAGYGKSSSLAQFFADEQVPFSWYHISQGDDGVLPFLRHLYASIQRVFPSIQLGDTNWDQFGRFPTTDELNKLTMLFVNALCEINEPFYIVLDDYHVISHDFQINYILNQLLELIPLHIHVVIATRTMPSWEVLRLLKRQGQLLLCEENDFTFSKEEIFVYFTDTFQMTLNDHQVERLYELTEGWAMAIFLIAMQGEQAIQEFEEKAKASVQDLFDYLSEEIFQQCPMDVQQSLLLYAIFPTFSNELISQFYSEVECEKLKDIVTRYTFIQPLASNEAYRYHSLLQHYLEQKWQEFDISKYIELNEQAARFYVQRGQIVEAFYHATKAKDEAFMIELLVQNAENFLRLGHFDWLIEQLKELSSATRETYYQLYFIEGECQRFRAFYEKAKSAYELCIVLAENVEDTLYVLKATAGLANIYLDTLQPSIAKKYLTDALTLANIVALPEPERVLLQRQYAENLVNLGFAYEAEHYIISQQMPKEVLEIGNIDIRVLLRQGRLQEARRLAEERLQAEQGYHDAHRETGVILSLIYALMGDSQLAKQVAFHGLENSRQASASYTMAVAHIRLGHAALIYYPYHIQHAMKHYEQALEYMDKMHVTRVKAECYMGLALAKSRLGHVEEGIADAQNGLIETERVHDRWVSGLLLLAQTVLYYENAKYEQAYEMALQALQLFQQAQDQYCEMVTHFWLCAISLTYDTAFFHAHFEPFSRLLTTNQWQFFIDKQTLFSPRSPMLMMNVLHFAMEQHVATSPDQTPYSYYVQLLGPVTLKRSDEWLSDKVWQREKAKELFVFLYVNRHRFVSKQEICEVLWQHYDDEAQSRAFKVAYNALLKVLEPDRIARSEPIFITRKNSLYKLQGFPYVVSDMEQFERASRYAMQQEGLYKVECLQEAIALYHGDFYQERQHENWIAHVREHLRSNYLQMHESIAVHYYEEKQYHECIDWAKQLVQLDVTWEEGYRLLMLSFHALQNRVSAMKWFETCKTQLKRELNIEPMESTIELYESIIR